MFACSLKFLSVSVTLSKSFNILCSCIPIAQMLYSSYIVVCYAYYTRISQFDTLILHPARLSRLFHY
ncbi:hypothetical protein ARMGADRAFT_255325 [Armillaria gallica]|uniref:Uncharacterized protein n=1 Tax=Armillaria gallica TaxID=47427 RepID=A0A2H3E4U4_ARMGA|nr:hypothetical protein ARMGADRAFT_255325 [Armillaria gallica]